MNGGLGLSQGHRALAAAGAIALAWCCYGIATIHQHGVTLDETSIFYGGDRTLFFLTHPTVPGALALQQGGEPQGFHSRFPRFPDFADTWHYPVLPGLLMSLTNALFHEGLGWVDDLDGHHLGLILWHGVGLFAFGFYACRLLGLRAGACAALAYALYPSIVGFAFNNPKDLPATDFYGATLLAAAAGLSQRRPRDLWAAGVLCGLSLASKLNGVFALTTLAVWLLGTGRLSRTARSELRADRLWTPLCALPVVAFGVFWLTWPWLWFGTPLDWVSRLLEYARFYLVFSHSARPTFTLFAFKAVFAMTPPLVLALAALGLGYLFTRRCALRPLRRLFLLWLMLPLLRITLPFSEFYDANRHFIEYIGALCALAGIGAGAVLELLDRLPRARALQATAVAAMTYVLWLPLRDYRPYEGAYFNGFVGGLGGAQAQALFFMQAPPHDSRASGAEGDFWNSSLRDALELARQIVPAGATLATCGPSSVNVQANLTAPVRYSFANWRDPHADYIYFMARECYCKQSDLRHAEEERPVIVRVTRGGGLIYEILGPKVPYALPPVSPHTRYEQLPHYPTRRAPPPRRPARRVPQTSP